MRALITRKGMALARFTRQAKRPYGVCIKMIAVAILGLCFLFVWSMFSSPSTSVTVQRESFDDIAEPVASGTRVSKSIGNELEKHGPNSHKNKVESGLKKKDEKKVNGSLPLPSHHEHKSGNKHEKHVPNRKKEKDKIKLPSGVSKENQEESQGEEGEKENEDEEVVVDDGKEEEGLDREGDENGETESDGDLDESVDQETQEKVENDNNERKKRKIKGPVFDPKAHYSWKLCSTRSKHNYMPCIDVESGFTKLQSYRHRERSCPKSPPMCLVPLPHDGYDSPVRWPESRSKVCFEVYLFCF